MNSTDPMLLRSCALQDSLLIESVMEKVLGQRHTPLQFKLPFGIIYSLLLLLGVGGNLCTCIVIARTRGLHTATNLYLFSLAVSDLLLLLAGVPHELHSIAVAQYPWRLGTKVCKLRNFLAELTPAVSVMTITCFTIERYIAIAHPLRAQILSSFRRTLLIIACIWLTGSVACVPVGAVSRPLAYAAYPNVTEVAGRSVDCPPPSWANSSGRPIPYSAVCNCADAAYCVTHFQVFSFAFFVVPMCIITMLYLLIAVALRRSSGLAGRRRSDCGDRRGHSSVVRMLGGSRNPRMNVVIVVTFFICWAPFHLQRLLATYGVLQFLPAGLTNALYYCSGSLFYISSTLNPVFYNLMSAKFRQGFRSVFCCAAGADAGRLANDTKSHFANTAVSRTNGASRSPSLRRHSRLAANRQLALELDNVAAANQRAPAARPISGEEEEEEEEGEELLQRDSEC